MLANWKKRVLSLFLAFVTTLGVLPTGVLSVEAERGHIGDEGFFGEYYYTGEYHFEPWDGEAATPPAEETAPPSAEPPTEETAPPSAEPPAEEMTPPSVEPPAASTTPTTTASPEAEPATSPEDGSGEHGSAAPPALDGPGDIIGAALGMNAILADVPTEEPAPDGPGAAPAAAGEGRAWDQWDQIEDNDAEGTYYIERYRFFTVTFEDPTGLNETVRRRVIPELPEEYESAPEVTAALEPPIFKDPYAIENDHRAADGKVPSVVRWADGDGDPVELSSLGGDRTVVPYGSEAGAYTVDGAAGYIYVEEDDRYSKISTNLGVVIQNDDTPTDLEIEDIKIKDGQKTYTYDKRVLYLKGEQYYEVTKFTVKGSVLWINYNRNTEKIAGRNEANLLFVFKPGDKAVETYDHIDVKRDTASRTGGEYISALHSMSYIDDQGDTVTPQMSPAAKDGEIYGWRADDDIFKSHPVHQDTTITLDVTVHKSDGTEARASHAVLTKDSVYAEGSFYPQSGSGAGHLADHGVALVPGKGYDISGMSVFLVSSLVCDQAKAAADQLVYRSGMDMVLNYATLVENAKVDIQGAKTLRDSADMPQGMAEGQFSFELQETGGDFTTEIGEKRVATNNAAGNFSFGEMEYDRADTHYYTVTETRGNDEGVAYDDAIYRVTVTAALSDNGEKYETRTVYQQSQADGSYQDVGGILFHNRTGVVGTEERVNWRVNLGGTIKDVNSLEHAQTSPTDHFTAQLSEENQTILVKAGAWKDRWEDFYTVAGGGPADRGGLVGHDGEDASAVNTAIRAFMETYVQTYPGDAAILASIRGQIARETKIVTVNGRRVDAGLLTEKYYGLQWYVVKCAAGAATPAIWSIDGVLLEKEHPRPLTVRYEWTGAPAGEGPPYDGETVSYAAGAAVEIDAAWRAGTVVRTTEGAYIFRGWKIDEQPAQNFEIHADTRIKGAWEFHRGVAVEGTITWVNKDDRAGTPTATITLYADGAPLDKLPTWRGGTYTFAGLPPCGANGDLITYTVAETGVSGASHSDDKFIVYDEAHAVEGSSPAQYAVKGYWRSERSGTDFTNTWVPARDDFSGKYGFTVVETDEKGGVITSDTADFALTRDGESGSAAHTTDLKTGSVKIGGLEAGTYRLTETRAPEGYEKAAGSWTVTIRETGETLIKVEKSGNIFTNIWNKLFGAATENSGAFTWDAGDNTLTVENARIMGTLTVSKTVTDHKGEALDAAGEFTFEIWCGGRPVDTLTMASGKSDTAEVPYGVYTIKETGGGGVPDHTWRNVVFEGVDSLDADGNGVIRVGTGSREARVGAANIYTRDMGDLEIVKRIPAGDWAAVRSEKDYGVTIAYGEGEGERVTLSYDQFEEENGYYTAFQHLRLPTGTYAVREIKGDIAHHDRTTTIDGKKVDELVVRVGANEHKTVTVVNDYELQKHDLLISKAVVTTDKSKPAPDMDFTFKVKLGLKLYEGEYTVTDSLTGASVGTATAQKGIITLKAGQTATVKEVPYGSRYLVSEASAPPDFTGALAEGSDADTGRMGDRDLKLNYVNAYFNSKTAEVTVSKEWSGRAAGGDVTVELLKNGASMSPARTVTLHAGNEWADTFQALPLYDSATAKQNGYTVLETALNGEEAEDGLFIAYGTHSTESGDREVLGVWTSGINALETRENNAIAYRITNTWTDADDTGSGRFTVRTLETGAAAPVCGAAFTLSGTTDGDFKPITQLTSKANGGVLTFGMLPAGTYTLHEEAPTGYTGAEDYTIVVGGETADGSALVRVEKPAHGSNIFQNIWNWVVHAGGETVLGADGTLTVRNARITGEARTETGRITITKTDGKDPITTDSATFTLTGTGAESTYTAGTETGGGKVTFTFGGGAGEVGAGTYTLSESKAPAGYLGTEETWMVTVSAATTNELKDGKWVDVTRYEAAVGGVAADTLTVANTKKTGKAEVGDEIIITKTDDHGAPLAGADFSLVDGNGRTAAEAVSGADGKLTFSFGSGAGEVGAGTYTLSETGAPEGFTKSGEAYTVEVTKAAEEKLDPESDTFLATTTYDAVIGRGGGSDALTVVNTHRDYTVTVTQSFDGIDALPDGFSIGNTYNDTKFTPATAADGGNGTFTWTMKVPYGAELTFTENGYAVSGYEVRTSVAGIENTVSGTVTVPANDGAAVAFTNHYTRTFNDGADVISGASLNIVKVDERGNGLAGAAFALTDAGGETVSSGVTAAGGGLTLNINGGYLGRDTVDGYTFALAETAPTGYTAAGPWEVRVTSGGVTVEKAHKGNFFYHIYDWLVSAVTGSGITFDGETNTLTVTNTRDAGGLTITKAVEGGPVEARTAKVYTFDVTGPADADGDYSGVTFTGGAATVTVAGAGGRTIAGLPTGNYAVTERSAGDIPYWTWTDPGVVTAEVGRDETGTAEVTNQYEKVPAEAATATLTIHKEVRDGAGNALDAAGRAYTFQITGKDVYGAPVDVTATVTIASGNTGSVDVPLTYGAYMVSEITDSVPTIDGHTWAPERSTTATNEAVRMDENAAAGEFTAVNVYVRDLGDLEVTGIFQDLTQPEIERLTGFRLTVAGPDHYSRQLTLADGSAVRSGGAGGRVVYTWTLHDVPTGAYAVSECRKDIELPEYSLTVEDAGQNGGLVVPEEDCFRQAVTLEKNGSAAITFQNVYTRRTGSLTITKAVEGGPSGAGTAREYTFQITGGPADADGDYSGVAFAGGAAAVTVTGADSRTIEGLPTGVYTVTEEDAGIGGYWIWKKAGDGAVTVGDGENVSMTVTNTYTEVPESCGVLTISKETVDNAGKALDTSGQTYAFRVTGTDEVHGAQVDRTETVTMRSGGRADAELILPYGTYTAAEVTGDIPAIEGYDWTGVSYREERTTVELSAGHTADSVCATNCYTPIKVPVTVVKTWSGHELPGSFAITISNADVVEAPVILTLDDAHYKADARTYTWTTGRLLRFGQTYTFTESGAAVSGSTLHATVRTAAGRSGGGMVYETAGSDSATLKLDGLWLTDGAAVVFDNRYTQTTTPPPVATDNPGAPGGPVGGKGSPARPALPPENFPENPTPLDPASAPVVEIPENEVPRAFQTAGSDGEDAVIVAEEPPLGNLPQTGGASRAVDPTVTLGLLALSLSMAAAGLAVTIGRKKGEDIGE